MTPYYEKDGIVIYHGDCREILPELPKVDLVLTDPPYGIDYQSNRRTVSQRKDKIVGDHAFPMWVFEEIKYAVGMMVFCRWDTLPALPEPKSFIVWDKGRHSMGDLRHEYGRKWEAIAFYPGPNHSWAGKRPVDIVRFPCVPATALDHPNEKPVGLLKVLLSHHKADTILDPFMGSGTTLVAARDLGRRAIGIEIEERYCQIAVKRLRQQIFPLTDTPTHDTVGQKRKQKELYDG